MRRKIPKKQWTSFDEIYELQEKLKMNDLDFMAIANCSSPTFYRWRLKGKAPAIRLAAIREELAKYYKGQYDEKMRIVWGYN